jgi:ABC-type amino acid transport substrate-binding protein
LESGEEDGIHGAYDGCAVGLRKDDEAFRTTVNAWIVQDVANSKLRQVYTKYFGTDLPAGMPKEHLRATKSGTGLPHHQLVC